MIDDVKYRSEAKKDIRVSCKNDGFFDYPNPWQPCVSSVQCPDPGKNIINHLTLTEEMMWCCHTKCIL